MRNNNTKLAVLLLTSTVAASKAPSFALKLGPLFFVRFFVFFGFFFQFLPGRFSFGDFCGYANLLQQLVRLHRLFSRQNAFRAYVHFPTHQMAENKGKALGKI